MYINLNILLCSVSVIIFLNHNYFCFAYYIIIFTEFMFKSLIYVILIVIGIGIINKEEKMFIIFVHNLLVVSY